MKPLIAGNWKMHKTPSEGVRWLDALLTRLDLPEHRALGDAADLLLNVPFTHIVPLAERAADHAVAIGAQDCSAHPEGAYTGEVSAAMLADAGASHVVLGHSERRAYHREDDALVNAKLRVARQHGLVPILCVGETEAQRDAGDAETVVLAQLQGALDGFALDDPADLVVAYEPVWAIGTGRTATAADAEGMCLTIRRALEGLHPGRGGRVRLLYGGSMKPANAAELLAKPDIDGGLIGGASLDVEALLAIASAASNHSDAGGEA